MAVSVVALGRSGGLLLGGLAAILGGAIVGITRRQAVELTEQTARMEVAVARTEVARARAELLAERNHLARELHDVLAHTLAALSLQLEAFGTVVDSEPGTSPAVREQLGKLCRRHRASFAESGPAQRLHPAAVLGLYRVVQEALTNVVKHAPGADTAVSLAWTTAQVSATVTNGPPSPGAPTPLAHSGGGYGLRGIAERLELMGGMVESGPTPDGWRVAATVPLATAPAGAQEQAAS